MAITLQCPCGKILRVGDEYAGQQGMCPVCGTVLEIPHLVPPELTVAPTTLRVEPARAPRRLERPTPSRGAGRLLLGLVIVGVLALGFLAYHLFAGGVPHVDFGEGQVIYYQGATEGEARRLGQALKNEGYFDNKEEKTVHLSHEAGEYLVAFVVEEPEWEEEAGRAFYRHLGARLAEDVFPHTTVTVQLWDDDWHPHATLKGALLERDDARLFYTPETVSEPTVRNIADVLQRENVLNGREVKTVDIHAEGTQVVVAVVVDDDDWDDPQVREQYEEVKSRLEQGPLVGRPLEVQLWDHDLKKRKVID